MTDVGGFILIEAKANVRLAGCQPASCTGLTSRGHPAPEIAFTRGCEAALLLLCLSS